MEYVLNAKRELIILLKLNHVLIYALLLIRFIQMANVYALLVIASTMEYAL